MSDYPIYELFRDAWPPLMREMSDAPKRLYCRGELPDTAFYQYLCIVGSRSYSPYGKDACERLIRGLAGRAIVIVSGLALGIDGVAHRAALDAGLPTVAVLGSGLNDREIYPQSNVSLAHEILADGGALISEYQNGGSPGIWSFPRRNRIMAGISSATLVIEGGAKSGTLITARLAMDYNRDVMVVPGPILSAYCEGSNKLLREGAIPITSSADILESLGMTSNTQPVLDFDLSSLSDDERMIVGLLRVPRSLDELVREAHMPPNTLSTIISSLEIQGIITRRLGMIERII